MDVEIKTVEILKKYPVKRAAFFGSFARGDETPESDIDILVEFSRPVGLDYFGLHVDLEDALGLQVDLVTYNALKKAKPYFRRAVESEARVFYEN